MTGADCFRREKILDCATVVFMEKGFRQASMSDISELAGGSKGTLYAYFQSKEELFQSCIERLSRQYEARVQLSVVR